MTSNSDKFTPTGSIAIKTAAEAKRYLGSAVSVWNRESKVITDRDNVRTQAAAYAIHAAVRTGYLGKTVTGGVVAASFGRSNAWVSQMRTLGIAFVDVRIDPASDLGRTLANGAAQNREVSAAIKAENATPATVAKVVADLHYGTDGKVQAQKDASAKRKAGGAANQTAPAEGTPALPRNNSGRIALVEQALAALKSPSAAERKHLGEVFAQWRDALNLDIPAPAVVPDAAAA